MDDEKNILNEEDRNIIDNPKKITPELLNKLYNGFFMSKTKIANLLNTSLTTIDKKFIKFKIKSRNGVESAYLRGLNIGDTIDLDFLLINKFDNERQKWVDLLI